MKASLAKSGRESKETQMLITFDTAAETDLVSLSYAQRYALRRLTQEDITLKGIHAEKPSLGIYEVPIQLTDSAGEVRVIRRACAAAERTHGTDVLLSNHTLDQAGIVLFPREKRWRFKFKPTSHQITSHNKMVKLCRREAAVYALITLEDPIVLPEEESQEDRVILEDLPMEIRRWSDVFDHKKAGVLPRHKDTDHAIDLVPGATPPYGGIYRLSRRELQEVARYLKEEVDRGRIRPSKSPAGAPILFVPKKDGTLRLCVDYRGLNKMTVKNRYALPLISEILDRVAGAKYFSKIDIKEAYYRIRIKEGDEWKTAFRTRYGHYEYLVLPFGLTNAPATFQSYIHQALRGLLDDFCIAYLDDILIFSKDRESHTKHLEQVLERLRDAELYAKPSKCSFYKDQVEFLGFVISEKGVEMDPERVRTIQEWPEIRSYHDIQVFLGFCNFYRRFISGYSRVVQPLTDLLKGSVRGRKPGSVVLSTSERAAFQTLIDAFLGAPLLRHFDPELPIRLETDASHFAAAGILSQKDEQGRWQPVAFWSSKFGGAQLDYPTYDKEMMAIVESFKHWRHYLEGSRYPIEVLSDHMNLQGFMDLPRLNGRQARWCLYLAAFDFQIKHQAGVRNPADGPSRRPDYEKVPDLEAENNYLPLLRERLVRTAKAGIQIVRACAKAWRTARVNCMKALYLGQDGVIGEIPPIKQREPETIQTEILGASEYQKQIIPRGLVRECTISEVTTEAEISKPLSSLIVQLQDGDPGIQRLKTRILYPRDRGRPGTGTVWSVDGNGAVKYKDRLWVPAEESVRQEILSTYHDDPLAGHCGVQRTMDAISRKFYWDHLKKDVEEYVQTCSICQGSVARRHRPYGELKPLPWPEKPWAEISMDFITGLPLAWHQGREVDAIFVVVDRFTKYCRFIPVPSTINAAELAAIFYEHILTRYGTPQGVVSDRGPIFTSEFWGSLCHACKIKRRLSTAFHPQTDGQTERMNQFIEHYLRCYIAETTLNWPALMPSAEWVHNSSKSSTTGKSPNEALMLYQPQIYTDAEGSITEGEIPAVEDRENRMRAVRESMREHWQSAVEAQKKYYDKKHTPLILKKGALVGLSTKNLRVKTPRKLTPKYIGPFRVVEAVGPLAYRLALPEKYDRLHPVFSVGLLEPWKLRKREQPDDFLKMPDLEDDPDEWEVEEVRGIRKKEGDTFYLVKWTGWPAEYNQWVAEEDMGNAQRAIASFRKRLRAGKGQGRRKNVTDTP